MSRQFYGHLTVEGMPLLRAGFMNPAFGPQGIEVGASLPLFTRAAAAPMISDETRAALASIERGEVTGDVSQILMHLGKSMAEFQRAITSTTTAFPSRENLEAEAKILVPLDTPLRNRLPRTPGSGKASAWKQVTSLGGGYGVATTVTTGASSATQTVGSTVGMKVGDTLYFATTAAARIISSITNATVVVLTATISTTTAEVVTKAGVRPGGLTPTRAFFAETGAPAAYTTVYADKSATYKLLGAYGSVTGFAMAAGANFQNQLATEKTNAIRNLMLNEEYALINGDSAATGAPWGDGTNALAFDGLLNLIAASNGTPADSIQAAVGALTTAHLDAQLSRLWNQGADGLYMLMNEQETRSLAHLAEASGSIIRVQATTDGQAVLGVRVTGYVHPVTGRLVEIIPSKDLSPGQIIFGSDRIADGSPAADVQVLPQVQLPELAPNDMVQGYTAQELAPTTAAPQVYPFIVSVYEVLRMKAATAFAKSTGVAAV